MKNNLPFSEEHSTLLAQRTEFCCGEPLSYSLMLCAQNGKNRFLIEARYLDQIECRDVGCDICSAVALLGLLSHAHALPVTLGAVVDDYFAENA